MLVNKLELQVISERIQGLLDNTCYLPRKCWQKTYVEDIMAVDECVMAEIYDFDDAMRELEYIAESLDEEFGDE